MKNLSSGLLLISDPFLKDPNFMRTVVLLCEHNPDGSFGFVLNRPYDQRLDDFIPALEGYSIPVFYGGPVQTDTLHFIHSLPNQIPDGQPIGDGIYWGGNFEQVIALVRQRELDLRHIRFFLGYSGWSTGQLEDEMTVNSWLTADANPKLTFETEPTEIWKAAVKELDEAFHEIIHYPIDPQLN
jgi:putative transcriptional regulator